MDTLFPAEETSLRLSSRETFHLERVLRLQKGDPCRIFNQKGQAAEAVVESFSETGEAFLRLKKILPAPKEEGLLFLRVAQALPQKGKMDDLVQKAEELAVHELWVLETDRTIVKMRAEARERARARWERIVVEAAKQSGSPVLTRVKGPDPFIKVVKEELDSESLAYLFHPHGKGISFSEMVEDLRESRRKKGSSSAFLFLGPEGGFTEEEVALARARGVKTVQLGESILRVETAFLGAISAIRFLLG